MFYFPAILEGPDNKILNKGFKRGSTIPKTPRLLPSQIEALIYIMQRFVGPPLSDGTKAGFFLGNVRFLSYLTTL